MSPAKTAFSAARGGSEQPWLPLPPERNTDPPLLTLPSASPAELGKSTPHPPPPPLLVHQITTHEGTATRCTSLDPRRRTQAPQIPCADNPHRISFAPDRRTFTLVYDHESPQLQGRSQLAVYDVKAATTTTAQAALRGEDRVDDSGALVEWTIEVVSDTEYCWRRSDWPSHACTPPRVRCGEEQGTEL